MSISYLGIPLRKDANQSPEEYLSDILQLIEREQKGYDIYVLPEYTWGSEPIDSSKLEKWLKAWNRDALLVLGTALVEVGDVRYNTILVYDNEGGLRKIAKRFPVLYEQQHRNVVGVESPPDGYVDNVIQWKGLKLGFGACSDLWQSDFIREMVEGGADMIVICSMTVTEPPLREYARVQWNSLAIARSREFVIPLIIVDSPYEDEEKVTGRVTCAVDPSLKRPELKTIDDFLYKPNADGFLRGEFDFGKIKDYRSYRDEQGLRIVN